VVGIERKKRVGAKPGRNNLRIGDAEGVFLREKIQVMRNGFVDSLIDTQHIPGLLRMKQVTRSEKDRDCTNGF